MGAAPSNSGLVSAFGKARMDKESEKSVKSFPLSWLKVCLMQRPLPGKLGSKLRLQIGKRKGPGGCIGTHDFVIVDCGSDHFILAEKSGKSKSGANDAGIHVHLMSKTTIDEKFEGSVVRYESRCIKLHKGRTVDDLCVILKRPSAHYTLLSKNCWKYAYVSIKSILQWCREYAFDVSEVEQELAALTLVEKPSPAAVIRLLFHRRRNPKSVATRRKLRTRLEAMPRQRWTRRISIRALNIISLKNEQT